MTTNILGKRIKLKSISERRQAKHRSSKRYKPNKTEHLYILFHGSGSILQFFAITLFANVLDLEESLEANKLKNSTDLLTTSGRKVWVLIL